jgi:hypothetical protein
VKRERTSVSQVGGGLRGSVKKFCRQSARRLQRTSGFMLPCMTITNIGVEPHICARVERIGHKNGIGAYISKDMSKVLAWEVRKFSQAIGHIIGFHVNSYSNGWISITLL